MKSLSFSVCAGPAGATFGMLRKLCRVLLPERVLFSMATRPVYPEKSAKNEVFPQRAAKELTRQTCGGCRETVTREDHGA